MGRSSPYTDIMLAQYWMYSEVGLVLSILVSVEARPESQVMVFIFVVCGVLLFVCFFPQILRNGWERQFLCLFLCSSAILQLHDRQGGFVSAGKAKIRGDTATCPLARAAYEKYGLSSPNVPVSGRCWRRPRGGDEGEHQLLLDGGSGGRPCQQAPSAC